MVGAATREAGLDWINGASDAVRGRLILRPGWEGEDASHQLRLPNWGRGRLTSLPPSVQPHTMPPTSARTATVLGEHLDVSPPSQLLHYPHRPILGLPDLGEDVSPVPPPPLAAACRSARQWTWTAVYPAEGKHVSPYSRLLGKCLGTPDSIEVVRDGV